MNDLITLELNKQYVFCSVYLVSTVVPSAPKDVKHISTRLYEILRQETETSYYVKILDSGANLSNKGYCSIDIMDYDYIAERNPTDNVERNDWEAIIWRNPTKLNTGGSETMKDDKPETKVCEWKKIDFGMMGFDDYNYVTSCGKNYDCDKTNKENYCPNCGGKII